jgi:hypothetical protein
VPFANSEGHRRGATGCQQESAALAASGGGSKGLCYNSLLTPSYSFQKTETALNTHF